MSSIKDNQMNLLSQLAYLDLPDDIEKNMSQSKKHTISDMVKIYLNDESKLEKVSGRCAMDKEEWRKTFLQIKNDPELCNLTIKGYTDQNKEGGSGLVAYCFEAGDREAVIAYRGSETREGLSHKDWEDNFQAGFSKATDQQKAAFLFLEDMKEKYDYTGFETTGHSKGGNIAQYVAIMSDDVKKCVSFDGQGFCDDFMVYNKPKILTGKDKIVAYEGNLDIVSSLLFNVAGKIIVIDTKDQKNFLYNHKPNLFLDENGNFYEETNKSVICYAVRTYTMRVSTLLPNWAGLYLVDSVFNILDGEFSIKEVGGVYVGLLALPLFSTNALFELRFLGIYYTGRIVLEYASKKLEELQDKMGKIANSILNKLNSINKKISELRDSIFASITAFLGQLRKGIEEFGSHSYSFATEPYLQVNTARLIQYANKLETIKRQISSINRRIHNLYHHADLFDLDNLLIADLMTENDNKLNKLIKYIYKSAELLESTENRLVRQANSL